MPTFNVTLEEAVEVLRKHYQLQQDVVITIEGSNNSHLASETPWVRYLDKWDYKTPPKYIESVLGPIEIKLRSGSTKTVDSPDKLDWSVDGDAGDIVAYRTVRK